MLCSDPTESSVLSGRIEIDGRKCSFFIQGANLFVISGILANSNGLEVLGSWR